MSSNGAPIGHARSPLVSIIINNHNYAHFLGHAIESALRQTYRRTEVIVVDDGSTDRSREVIKGFGDRIRSELKVNGGQASAINAGVAASRGEVLCFLDADDLCRRNRAAHLVQLFDELPRGQPLVLYHRLIQFGDREHDLPLVPEIFRDLDGRELGGKLFRVTSAELVYLHARRFAYIPFLAPPTSGLALNRRVADRIFPIPEAHQVGADCLVVRAAMLVGDAFATDEVLGLRRWHEANHSREVQKHLIDEAFLKSMDVYLNRILTESGKEAVISVFDSSGAVRYYKSIGSSRDLGRLAGKELIRGLE